MGEGEHADHDHGGQEGEQAEHLPLCVESAEESPIGAVAGRNDDEQDQADDRDQ